MTTYYTFIFLGQAKPPPLCGWDAGSGDDLFCCENTTKVKNPTLPKKYG